MRSRNVLGVALALVGTAAAIAAALVPAEAERAVYRWPPKLVPARAPAESWVTPLMLSARTADAISLRLPCRPGPFLRDAGAEPTVIATGRRTSVALSTGSSARRAGVLRVSWLRARGALRITVGARLLGLFAAPASRCGLTARIDGRRWTVRHARGASRSGRLAEPVAVTGLLSQLDLRSTRGVSVEVVPAVQDTRPSPAQTALRIGGASALVVALWLLARLDLRELLRRTRRPRRPVATLPDAAVLATLGAWGIVGPAVWDDGWVAATQRNSLHSGGFSTYYTNSAANLAFGTWLNWLQHFVVAYTPALVLQRLPELLVLAALWLVCRAILAPMLGHPPRKGDLAWWSAALTFCVGATAFGVTLRPEPVNALLVGGVLLAMARFVVTRSQAALCAAALLAALALSEHPEGLVALAPVVVCLPLIARELRVKSATAALGTAGAAICGAGVTILLTFLDSDLEQRRADAAGFALDRGHSYGISDEPERYRQLWDEVSVRREFVFLCLLAVLALVWSRGSRLRERLPSLTVLAGLLLLAPVPSKWPWHFGVLLAPAATGVGIGIRWLARRLSGPEPNAALTLGAGLLVLVGVPLAAFWGSGFGPTDLASAPTGLRIVGPLVGVLWTLAAIVAVGHQALTGRTGSAWRVLRRETVKSLPILLVPLLLAPTLLFVGDALATSGWTYTSQNLSRLVGRDTCGIADDLLVPDPRSIVPLGTVAASRAPPSGSHWYRLPPPARAVGLDVRGARAARIDVRWARLGEERATVLRSGAAAAAEVAAARTWRSVSRVVDAGKLSRRPRRADALAASAMPVSYVHVPLRRLVATEPTLVSPFLVEAVPCARLPVVALGFGAPPVLVVDWVKTNVPVPLSSAVDPTGPFGALPDLFHLRRLWSGSLANPHQEIDVYQVVPEAGDVLLQLRAR